MATIIQTIVNKNGDTILPRTRTAAITLDDGTPLNTISDVALAFKGPVADFAALPSVGVKVGDLYYVTADEVHYFWNGSDWVVVGGGGGSSDQVELANFDAYFTGATVEDALSELYEQDLFISDDAITWTDNDALSFIIATDEVVSDPTVNNAHTLDYHTFDEFALLETTYTKTQVDNLITNLIDAAPDALNTLNELSAALNDDENFGTTVTNALSLKANSADVYTITEVDNTLSSYATLASPSFTGTVAVGAITDLESEVDSKASTGKAIAMAIVFGG